ncbi:citrate transporter [Candidatus Pacearchaeota archaeon]|nr:MAG: citrate transporter [Candidatus Pacearchaeota archaeon]
MRLFFVIFIILLYSLLPNLCFSNPTISKNNNEKINEIKLFISGSILDPHKEPLREAEIKLLINGKPHKIIVDHKEKDFTLTSSHGTYQIEALIPSEVIEKGKIELEVFKTNFKKAIIELKKDEFGYKGNTFYIAKDIILERHLAPSFYIATIVFIIIYALIAFELLHRTIAALIGAAIMLILTYTLGTIHPEYHIISFERAMEAIDLNVIFLLMGMMIIIGVLKHTGVFQWCAYMSYKIARGNVFFLNVISCIFIAVTSAFLDNVTTMLLYTPVLIEIAVALRISPFALLLPGIMASNVGGTATLIGDPPNIMIGSYTGLTFMEFVKNLSLVCLISMIALVIYNQFFYGKDYKKGKVDDVEGFIAKLKEEYKITDKTLLTYGLLIMLLVVSFFITHGYWHMEVSIPALFGASLLFTYGVVTKRVNMFELIEKDIEWSTLLFFIFLFILVGAVEEVGLLAIIADWVYHLSKGSLLIAITLIIWVAAIMSAFVDNIPFTATMLPIVAYLSKVIPGAESNVLWWALAFGACFGGNGTMIGASANVVTVGILESAGYRITFLGFMKYAFLYMIITVLIANIWLLIFY